MQATVGDMLVVRGHRQGEPERHARILEVHGPGGNPPFLVRWDDDGHVGLMFPGPDAYVSHVAQGHSPGSRHMASGSTSRSKGRR